MEFHFFFLCLFSKRLFVLSGNLTRAGISSDHFSYVFIDESASAFETSVMIPIAGSFNTLLSCFFCFIPSSIICRRNFFFRNRSVHISEQSACKYRTCWRSKAIGRCYKIRTGQRIGLPNIVPRTLVRTAIVQAQRRNQEIQRDLHYTIGAKLSVTSNDIETIQ